MKQEIIDMARQAGLRRHIPFWSDSEVADALEAFAKLVDDKATVREREAWSKVCEDIRKVFNEKADLAYVAGQKEEREACANVAKRISDKYAYGYYGNEVDTADEIESEIRARGQA